MQLRSHLSTHRLNAVHLQCAASVFGRLCAPSPERPMEKAVHFIQRPVHCVRRYHQQNNTFNRKGELQTRGIKPCGHIVAWPFPQSIPMFCLLFCVFVSPRAQIVPILMALSTNSLLLLDQRTLQIKYRIPATEIYRLSLSPYHDNIAVFHVKAVSVCTHFICTRV